MKNGDVQIASAGLRNISCTCFYLLFWINMFGAPIYDAIPILLEMIVAI